MLKKEVVSNVIGSKKKCHGEMLTKIANYIRDSVMNNSIKVFIRERAISRYNTATQVLLKVVGVSDMVLWTSRQSSWQEVGVSSAKKAISGNGSADKRKVAEHLTAYLGEQTWKYDDESDAASVGVAWLIDNGYIDPVVMEKEESK